MHGLEKTWKEKVQFFHVDFRSRLGKELGRRFQIEHLPALLILDGGGQVQWRLGMGLPHRSEIESRLAKLEVGLKLPLPPLPCGRGSDSLRAFLEKV